MERIRDAARIARSLSLASTTDEIWTTLKTFGAPLGFSHLTVVRKHPALPLMLAPSLVYIDAPQGFAADFDRDQLCPDDPWIARAFKQLAPFSTEELRATQLTEQQRRVLQHVSLSLNVRDGWTFPISFCNELRGIAMLGGVEPDMSPLMCSMFHLLTHTAYKRYEELEQGVGQKSRILTPRELECLRWVALGKTDEEIAVILSISARTARFHVENAKRKLGVSTRVQAVAEAMKLQAIAA